MVYYFSYRAVKKEILSNKILALARTAFEYDAAAVVIGHPVDADHDYTFHAAWCAADLNEFKDNYEKQKA